MKVEGKLEIKLRDPSCSNLGPKINRGNLEWNLEINKVDRNPGQMLEHIQHLIRASAKIITENNNIYTPWMNRPSAKI